MKENDNLAVSVKDLDESMSVLLTQPSTKHAMSFARKVKNVQMKLDERSGIGAQVVGELYSDSLNLHRAILIFERDPEMIKQNTMARLISGATPALLSLEEFLSGEDVNLWELLIDGTAVISHLVATTPYITSSKIAVDFRFQEELVQIEERLVDLFCDMGDEIEGAIESAARICDDLREKEIPYSEKPSYIFVLRYAVLMVTYKIFRDTLQG